MCNCLMQTNAFFIGFFQPFATFVALKMSFEVEIIQRRSFLSAITEFLSNFGRTTSRIIWLNVFLI